MKFLNKQLSLWPHYKRYTRYAKQGWPWYMAIALSILLLSISNTAIIWYLGVPFNLIEKGDYSAMMALVTWFILLILVNRGAYAALDLFTEWCSVNFDGRLRSTLFRHLLLLSTSKLQKHNRGDLLVRLNQDILHIEDFIIEIPILFSLAAINVLFYSAMLLVIDVQLAMITLLLSPLFIFQQRLFAPYQRKISQGLFKQRGLFSAFEEDSLNNLRNVSSFNAESTVVELHRKHFLLFRRWAMKRITMNVLFRVSLRLLIYVIALVVVTMGVIAISQGRLATGELVSFVLYLAYLSFPIQNIANLPFKAQSHVAACERVSELLDSETQVLDEGKTILQEDKIDIRFQQLDFTYPNGKTVLKNFDLHIPAGDCLAIVGPSGVGKSTIIKLLLRFYDPTQGQILINGTDSRHYSLGSLRDHITVVWQEPQFFRESIRANLLMANPNATEAEIISALKSAQAWPYIENLKDGLDSHVGKDLELSTGQKQRLALAQAFLRQTPLLILDEASSALDSETEQRLIQVMEKLIQGRSTLIIAHRYASLQLAQKVLYLSEPGQIHLGHHEHMMKTVAGYRQAVEWQTKII